MKVMREMEIIYKEPLFYNMCYAKHIVKHLSNRARHSMIQMDSVQQSRLCEKVLGYKKVASAS